MIWTGTKTVHSLSGCHRLYPTFQLEQAKYETAAETPCGFLIVTPLFLLIVFCSVASLTELDPLKMTWLTGNNWQITRLLMHRGREWQIKSESCLRLETMRSKWRFPSTSLLLYLWVTWCHSLIYATFWEHATWWPSLPKKATLSLP